MDALAGAQTSGEYLRGSGSHVVMSAIQAADVPQLSQYNPIGLTGATAPTSYAGGTVSGPPITGTWTTGQWVVDQSGQIWACISGGTSGTWRRVGHDPWQFFPEDYGAKGDGRRVIDAATTTGSTSNLTSATAAFTSADVGKVVYAYGAGAACADLTTTISAYVNSTTVTLTAAPGTAVTSKFALIGTDDTAAINAAVSAATAYAAANDGYAEIVMRPVIYVLNGAATIGGATAGNALIPLPVISTSAASVTLALKGAWGDSVPHWLQATPEMSGTTLACTNLSGTNDATYGPAFVIGGPWNGYGDSTFNFTNVRITVEGIRVATPFNGTFGGFGFWGMGQARVRKSSYMPMAIVPSGGAAPHLLPGSISNQWTIGLLMPSVNNNDMSEVDGFTAYGATFGLMVSEHCRFDNIRVNYNVIGVCPVVGGNGVAGHQTGDGGYVSAEGNNFAALGTYVAANNISAKLEGFPKFRIRCLDVEIPGGGYVIHDPTNVATGDVGVMDVGTGYLTSTLPISGGTGIRVIALAQLPGPVSSPQAPPSSTSGWVNAYYRDAEITLSVSGGSLSALTLTGAGGAVSQVVPASSTFYRFTLPSGQTYTPTYTGALTHTVTLL